MKKLIFITVFIKMLFAFGYAQNNVKIKFIIPANHKASVLKVSPSGNTAYVFSNFLTADDTNTSMLAFLNDQPMLKLKASPKKYMLLSAQLSFTDLAETTISNLDTRLLNTYDDHISELFRDAPSLFTLICRIGL